MVTETRTRYCNPKKAVKNANKLSAMALGVIIAGQAKALCPVDKGQLRNSISASSLTQTSGLNSKLSEEHAEPLNTKGLKGNQVFVGSSSDHAIFMEYGTVKTSAQPFLKPAIELQKSRVSTIFKKLANIEMGKPNG